MENEAKKKVPTTTVNDSPFWVLGAVYDEVNDEKKMGSDVDGHGEETGAGVSRSKD